jgi:hypothetical protein
MDMRNMLFATIFLPDEDGFYHPEQKTADRFYGDHAVKLANLAFSWSSR